LDILGITTAPVPEVAAPELAAPELAASELAASELAASELAAPELAASELAAPEPPLPPVVVATLPEVAPATTVVTKLPADESEFKIIIPTEEPPRADVPLQTLPDSVPRPSQDDVKVVTISG